MIVLGEIASDGLVRYGDTFTRPALSGPHHSITT